jgi:hypothetical protein
MATQKMFDLDKMVTDAKKRLVKHIAKLAEKAQQETAADFTESRKRLNIK